MNHEPEYHEALHNVVGIVVWLSLQNVTTKFELKMKLLRSGNIIRLLTST